MAQIVTITNPLTGQPAQVDQLDHTAQQIDDGLNIARGVSNPNLLDNWYFANPVNQRGQTKYTGEVYGIDRWIAQWTGEGVTLIEDGCVSIYRPSNEAYLCQRIADDLGGQTVTFSTLCKGSCAVNIVECDSGWSFKSFIVKNGAVASNDYTLFTGTGVVPQGCKNLIVELASATGVKSQFKAAKLELGSQQTLAHQDADGNWVLNEIPDYGEQLARCQRYFYAVNTEENQYACFGTGIAYSSTKAYITVPIPVKMRAFPGITKQGSLALFLNGDYTAIAVSAISAVRGSMQGLFELEVTAIGLTPGATYYLAANTDGAARLFFNSEL